MADTRVKPQDIDAVLADGNVTLLDVRDDNEIELLGGYHGAINIPMSQLETRLGELPKDRPILTA